MSIDKKIVSRKKPLEHLIKKAHEKTDRSDDRHHGHHFVMIGMVGIVALVGLVAVILVSLNKPVGMAYNPADFSEKDSLYVSSSQSPSWECCCQTACTSDFFQGGTTWNWGDCAQWCYENEYGAMDWFMRDTTN